MTKKVPFQLQEAFEEVMSLFLNRVPVTEMNFGKVVADDLMGYGTTKEEFIRNIQEYQRFIQVQEDQSKGLAMNFQREPIHEYLSKDKTTAINVEEITITIDTEDSVSQFTVRLSIAMGKIGGHWKMVHFHGSVPVETAEEDTWHLKEWEKEKEKLEKLVAEQTGDLLRKNRELEIEAAVERIRAQSMSMQHPEDLNNVNQELLTQLKELKIKGLTGVSIWLFDNDEMVTAWDLSSPGNMGDPSTATIQYDPKKYNLLGEPWRILQESDDDYFVLDYPIEKLEKAVKEWEEVDQKVANDFKKALANGDLKHQWNPLARHSNGVLSIDLTNPPLDDTREIITKMAEAFNLAYTRFLDLQKAEAQAREAKIEAALERVRARSMGMHKSDDLIDVVREIGKGIHELGIQLHYSQIYTDYTYDPKTGLNIWVDVEGQDYLEKFHLPYIDHSITLNHSTALNEGLDYFSDRYSKAEKDSYFKLLFKYSDLKRIPKKRKELILNASGWTRFTVILNEATLNFGRYSLDEFTDEEHEIFIRFAKVFGQAYTRFLDLKKAEEQVREAEVQLALERVRAKTMAMKTQSDLLGVVELFGEQLKAVGVRFDDVTVIDGPITKSRDWELWSHIPAENGFTRKVHIPYTDTAYFTKTAESVEKYEKTGNPIQVKSFTQSEKNEFLDHYFKHAPAIPDNVVDLVYKNPGSVIVDAFLKEVTVSLVRSDLEPYTDEELEIFERFSKEFRQTYIRFLDIQKSEKQAREAEIEAALERVRSRSMGMQKSSDLRSVVDTLYGEFKRLGLTFNNVVIQLLLDDTKDFHMWITSEDGLYEDIIHWPYVDIPVFNEFYEARKGNKTIDYRTSSEAEVRAFFEEYFKLDAAPQERKAATKQVKSINNMGTYLKHTGIFLMRYTEGEYSEKDKEIVRRFSKVFEQTYTRFLDLQKAETQAREAQIENALEKVRSRSLAMQHPNELVEVAQLLREEMGALGVEELETSSIYIHDDTSGLTQCWFTIKNADDPGKSVTDQMTINLQDTWVGRQMHEFYDSGQDSTSILMKGDHRVEWIRYCEEKSDLFGTSEFYGETIPERTYHLYKFSSGFLGAASPGDISEESWNLMKRATGAFSFAYTRFRDLQKAEENALRARQQASLDRVRADISGMRSAEDLNRVTPLIWRELTTLGIPFIRCGVFIIHEEEEKVEVYLSKPDATSLAVMHLHFDSNELVTKTVEAWRNKEVYTQHWSQEEFLEWGRSMMEQNQVADLETYQGAEEAPESLNLQFIPFNQGMLYVGSTGPLDDEDISLSESLAKAFSIAYARYEDFVKLEKAKIGIEDALTELKATQSQLIQQEKLASLGQLTAGIAHEIKNPLNFVNNFSELSAELIQEVREEIESVGAIHELPLQDVYDILDDIEANLKTIHKHGSRADSIVKSMLEHSRGGTGKAEPTNINALVKEFANLSFHGMRASKDPINVDMQFELDDSIGGVPLIAEDFSRVIVNLCNNGFDAMREKQNSESRIQNSKEYKPKLSIRSQQSDKSIIIEIEDNGPGIPDEMKDKILQPFFTTKKGTEGTGLGLSITNDIIKAHRGKIHIESHPDSGTNFIITLHHEM